MELNKLGLKLFFVYNNFAEAIKVLNLNIREYPESYNVYDSIGYVYMNHGNSENALRAFKKGIQIYHLYPQQNVRYKEDYTRALKHINRLEEEQNN
jgi:tetratricopeptide (TPR) repeat protein